MTEAHLQRIDLIPILWHSENGKTMETGKKSVVDRGHGAALGEQADVRWFLGCQKFSVWHYKNRHI